MRGRPRVLLVDDDASIRRFVEMALEELDIELIACPGVAEALAVLQAQAVDLLITDLMMPGQTGFDLLQQLVDHPEWRGKARQAVFSAGLNPGMQARLAPFDIWRQLPKPISLGLLEDCVREGVSVQPPKSEHTLSLKSLDDETTSELTSIEQAAVERHFAGDRGLFLAFRASCMPQFAIDIQAGDAAVASTDAAALRRLAHSLKSVLATLGHEALGTTARQLEDAAAGGDWGKALSGWAGVRQGLLALQAVAAAARP